jgi:S1-C subfamily serine protease
MAMGTSVVEIDARPSDSIVLALKFKVPIYVDKHLFKNMALPLGDRPGVEEQYGLKLQDLSPSIAQYFSFESTEGVLVSEVHKGSHADKDGIAVGDIIVDIDGKVIADVRSMVDALKQNKPSLAAKIFRKDRYLTITLHLK